MIKFTTIATENSKFELSATIENGKYLYPSLTINFNVNGEESIDIWDNPLWLINELLPVLRSNEKDPNDELDIRNSINEEEDKELVEIFEEGIKMGFFDHLYNKELEFSLNNESSFTKDEGDSL